MTFNEISFPLQPGTMPQERDADRYGGLLYFSDSFGWYVASYSDLESMLTEYNCTHWAFTPEFNPAAVHYELEAEITKPMDQTYQRALKQKLFNRTAASGEIRFPAVPSMIDEMVESCEKIFFALEAWFSSTESGLFRAELKAQLDIAWEKSQRSEVLIRYTAPVGNYVEYEITPLWSSLSETYNQWVELRDPPFFGTHPDACVWSLAWEATEPNSFPILDIGAGTGRNSLALARRGHPVDAVELSSEFATSLRKEAEAETLSVRVIEQDISTSQSELRDDYQLVVLSEVTPDFRSAKQLRDVFKLVSECLAPGGKFVLNLFLPKEDYIPDTKAKELGQQVYSCLFTRFDLATALSGLPLQLIADECVLDYEQNNLPEEAWPPTGWYERWTQGLDLFDVDPTSCPVELRWLIYKKQPKK
jgi:SAM-dependent methyltransferase